MHMKQSSNSNPAKHLKNGINYIMKDEKTEHGIWIGGNAGSSPDEVYQTFLDTKKEYGKLDGRQGYHFVISFKEDADEETIYKIMGDFCKEYLGDSYDYVYAIHNDTKHPHAHVIFNSVSRTTGLKYHYKKGDWEKYIQTVTDKVCQKYGFSKFEYEGGEHKNYGEWLRERSGKRIWKKIIKNDIDSVIPGVQSYQELLNVLVEKGYKLRSGKSKYHEEYLSITPAEGGNAVRSYQLGKGYQLEEIKKRIDNKSKVNAFKPDRAIYSPKMKAAYNHNGYVPKRRVYITPYQFYYIKRYCKNSVLYQYQNKRNYNDIRETEDVARTCRYLIRNGIRTGSELLEREEALKNKLTDLHIQRSSLYRNGLSPEEIRAVIQYQSLLKEQKEAVANDNDLAGEVCQDELERIENKYQIEFLQILKAERDTQLKDIRNDIKAAVVEEKIIRKMKESENKTHKIKGDIRWKNTPTQPKK